MYSYSFVLPANFLATGGVKYWVQIQAFQYGTAPDWGIAKGTGGDSSHYVKGAGVGGDIRYYSAPGDGAFTILGLSGNQPRVFIPVIDKP